MERASEFAHRHIEEDLSAVDEALREVRRWFGDTLAANAKGRNAGVDLRGEFGSVAQVVLGALKSGGGRPAANAEAATVALPSSQTGPLDADNADSGGAVGVDDDEQAWGREIYFAEADDAAVSEGRVFDSVMNGQWQAGDDGEITFGK